jgi:hypothetical protein
MRNWKSYCQSSLNALNFFFFKSKLVLFVCLLESNFFWKVNSGKVNSGKMNYFLIFGSVMKNKLENTFQYLVM